MKIVLCVGLLLSVLASTTPAEVAYPERLLSGTSDGGFDHGPSPKAAPGREPHAAKAPIALSWRLSEAPRLGEAVSLTLDLHALTALSAEVHLAGEEGLEVDRAGFAVAHRRRGEHWTTQVQVTPQVAAKRYLNVVVSTLSDTGEKRLRGFAVPVVVDPGAVRAKGGARVVSDARGVAVLPLPASEEVLTSP